MLKIGNFLSYSEPPKKKRKTTTKKKIPNER